MNKLIGGIAPLFLVSGTGRAPRRPWCAFYDARPIIAFPWLRAVRDCTRGWRVVPAQFFGNAVAQPAARATSG
jgi:hypothetical protein